VQIEPPAVAGAQGEPFEIEDVGARGHAIEISSRSGRNRARSGGRAHGDLELVDNLVERARLALGAAQHDRALDRRHHERRQARRPRRRDARRAQGLGEPRLPAEEHDRSRVGERRVVVLRPVPDGALSPSRKAGLVEDVHAAVSRAAGLSEADGLRVWTLIRDVPEGNWGAGGQVVEYQQLVEFAKAERASAQPAPA
jgi:phenylpyruvate tautomerase PptA (4-oxalocrotonate tautomerase family)